MKVYRRDFLQSAGTALGVTLLDRISSPDDLEKTIKEIRGNILDMINEEREVEKAPPVKLDEFATEVATKHAWAMVRGEFTSHWGRDGLKPYHRYSFAGGTDATAENVSSADKTWSTKEKDLKLDTAYLHLRLYQEKPPNDGHRKTVLRAQHAHVGLGIVVHELRLRMVELFVSRYVEVRPVVRESRPGANVLFTGKIRSGYRLNSVQIHYEALPEIPDLDWLRVSGSYSLPKDPQVLRPRLKLPYVYADGGKGVVDIAEDGSFSVPVKLYRNGPGIYTIVTWIRAGSEPAFPATEVCVKAL